ncbi:MAG: SpoIID protein [Parachlamydiales bacterium]|nr:SpoIID protein [Parachlamydiales bacterium]
MRIIPAIIAAALCGVSLTTIWADVGSTPDANFENIAEPAAPQNIQVLLERDATEALLEVKGSYFLFNPQDGTKVASGLLGKRFMVHATPTGLKWGEEFPGFYQLLIQPRSDETSIFINGIQYSGSVAIYAVGNRINIVNDLDIESYVKSLLSVHLAQPLESEVMSAMAILIRTNAYYTASRHHEAFWNVFAADVGYQGSGLISPVSSVAKAVESTRHLILVHPKEGRSLPFATSWTEHSAGKTAAFQTMFRKDAFAISAGVEAPHAALDRKDAKWNYSIAKKTLAHLLDVPQINSIELFVDASSNKVYGLRIKDGHDAHDIDFFTLQERLGKQHLLSSDFTVSLKEESVSFSGFGKGHGVGLCLYSASAMAQNGDNAIKILSKFFPETYLLNLNAIPEKKTEVR